METVETKKVQAGCAGVPVCAQVDSAHLRGETQLGNTTHSTAAATLRFLCLP